MASAEVLLEVATVAVLVEGATLAIAMIVFIKTQRWKLQK